MPNAPGGKIVPGMEHQGGGRYRLEVSRMDPLDEYDPAALAAQLAQHLSDADRLQKDSQAFAEAAQRERQKAHEIERLIIQVRERRQRQAVERGNP